VREEHAELLAHLALEHVGMPVPVRAERRSRIVHVHVHVQRAQAVETHRGVDRVEDGRVRVRVGHVDPAHVQVA